MRTIVLVLLTLVSIVLVVRGLTYGVTECTTVIAGGEIVRESCRTDGTEQLYAIGLTLAGGGLLAVTVWNQVSAK